MSDPDGGYFAAPLPVPPLHHPPAPAETGVPPLVVAAVTSLGLAGVASLWLGLTMLAAGSTFGDYGGSSWGPDAGLWTLNGLANLALVALLLRGVDPARWAATLICGCWGLYWLYQLTRWTDAVSTFGLQGLTFMGTLGLLLLAAWAAATAAALWTGPASRHFAQL